MTSNIPHCKVNILVLDSFDVESNGWNGGYNLPKFQFVKDGGLTSSIKTNCESIGAEDEQKMSRQLVRKVGIQQRSNRYQGPRGTRSVGCERRLTHKNPHFLVSEELVEQT